MQSQELQSRSLTAITTMICESLVRLVENQTDGKGQKCFAVMFTKPNFLLFTSLIVTNTYRFTATGHPALSF